MPPHIGIYDNAGVPADVLAFDLSTGETSAVVTLQVWNDKGGLSGDTTTATGLRIGARAFDGARFVADGVPPLDERWLRLTVVGIIDPGAVGIVPQSTATLPLGTASTVPLDDIPKDTARTIQVQISVPGSVGGASYRVKLDVYGNENSFPLSAETTRATGAGVIPADRVPSLRRLLRGSVVTANDTDTVTIGRGAQSYDGTMTTFLASPETFNLNDSAAVALAAGEQYRVTLSRDAIGAVVVTKGLKGAAAPPATPAGNIFFASLIVTSADGATVAVAPASVTTAARRYAQYLVTAGAGLGVRVAPGDGLTDSDRRQYSSADIVAAVVATATNRVWIIGNGSVAVTQTADPPEPGALLLAIAVTDAGAVTEIVDVRSFAHPAVTMWRVELVFADVLSTLAVPVLAVALAYLGEDAELEAVELNRSANDASWTADGTKIDIRAFPPGAAVPYGGGAGVGGASIYTGSGTDDARPVIAFDDDELRFVAIDHEVRRFAAGTRFVMDVVETVAAPAAEPPQELRATLHFRRYR